MSDETIQYITTDYLIEVDGGEPAPAPIEYIVELGQVGVQGIPGEKGEPGFSPTVGYILSDDTFRINITNQDGVTQTPNLYDYFASIEDVTTKLNKDGSNATDPITLNNITIDNSNEYITRITAPTSKGFQFGYNNNGAYRGSITFSDVLGYGQIRYYGSTLELSNGTGYLLKDSDTGSKTGKEIAIKSDIGNATITLTQGGVTKGTFTTNQSGDTTIDLDAGGGSITNPLILSNTDSGTTYSLKLGIDTSTNKIVSLYDIDSGGGGIAFPQYLVGAISNPLTKTVNSFGSIDIGLAYDSTTLGINSDNELYVIGGGGGTTYTAGTGIDITSNIISVEDTQEFDTVTLANTIGNNGEGLYGTIADGSSTLPLVRIDSLDNALFGNTTSELYLFGDNTRPYYNNSTNTLALYSDIPTNSTYVDLTSAQTITGKKTFSGAELETNNIITLSNNAIIRGLHSGNYNTYLSSNSTSLLLGNESNNIILRGNTTRPVYRTNSTDYNIALSGDIPTNSDYVDLTTDQNIAGTKAFTGTLRLISGSTVIRNSANTGNVGAITSDATSLIISTPAGNRNINLKPNGTGEVQANGNKVIDETDLATTSTAGIVQPDGSTITVNNGVVKTEGVINQQDSTTTLKYWTGTKQQYDAIVTKDSNTLYNVTDDYSPDNLANISLSNINNEAKIVIAHNAMPSNTYDDLTLGASGSSYTAPADGWFYLNKNASAIGQYLSWYVGIYHGIIHSVNTSEYTILVPITKGNSMTLYDSFGGTVTAFRFIYAIGSESEVS